jgi:hypothetical protein
MNPHLGGSINLHLGGSICLAPDTAAKIDGRDHDPGIIAACFSREHEEFLHCRIADSEAADRDGIPVDHDVAAELGAVLPSSARTIVRVRVVHPKRKVESAIRVQGCESVDTLGNLSVALPELRPEAAACGQDRIGLYEPQWLPRSCGQEMGLFLKLERRDHEPLRWIRNSRSLECRAPSASALLDRIVRHGLPPRLLQRAEC